MYTNQIYEITQKYRKNKEKNTQKTCRRKRKGRSLISKGKITDFYNNPKVRSMSKIARK